MKPEKTNYKREFQITRERRRKSDRRRMTSDRREDVRWEPDKPKRRGNKRRDRRKAARTPWDDVYKPR